MTTEQKKKLRYVLFFSILVVVLGSLWALLYHMLIIEFFDRQLNLNTWITFTFAVLFLLPSGFVVVLTWFKIQKMFTSLVPKDWVKYFAPRRKNDTSNA